MIIKQIYLDEILSTPFKLMDNLPINENEVYGDAVWDFNDASKVRNNSLDSSYFRFEWIKIKERIGIEFTNDIKIITYFMIFAPSIFGKSRMYKVSSVNSIIHTVVRIIESIQRVYQEKIGLHSINVIKGFSELSLTDFEKVIIVPSSVKNIKVFLSYIANPVIKKYFSNSVNWTEYDVKRIKFIIAPKDTLHEASTQPLDTILYSELIKACTRDILSFKHELSQSIHSTITPTIQQLIKEKKYSYNVAEAFEEFATIREIEKRDAEISGRRMNTLRREGRKFKKKYGIKVEDFNSELMNVQRACILAILTFTGMRYSELISLRTNCILKRFDVYIIKGTITKNRDVSLPTDDDEWVAIPIVRDAVELLEMFLRLSFNSYLVSSLFLVYLNRKDTPYSDGEIGRSLNKYMKNISLNNIDVREFIGKREHVISVHRLRHSLAQQLVRGKLGLPYISYHLKHVNSAVVAYNRVSNTTLGYGGISKEITNNIKHYRSAKKELYNEIYHPSAVVVGGKVANEFMQRKKEYFSGMMVDDVDIDEIIEELKNQSLPFLDVGLGYCAGRKDTVLKDGTKKPPPCIGQLKCNPLDCGNAIIPKSKMHTWQKVYEDAYSKLNDADFSYMVPELKETIERAEYVLNHFRENKDE